jgi:hypothetical protein
LIPKWPLRTIRWDKLYISTLLGDDLIQGHGRLSSRFASEDDRDDRGEFASLRVLAMVRSALLMGNGSKSIEYSIGYRSSAEPDRSSTVMANADLSTCRLEFFASFDFNLGIEKIGKL